MRKGLAIVLLCFLTMGCAGRSIVKIHSPQAKDATPLWFFRIHVAALSSSPPDEIIVRSLEDSSVVVVIRAEPIAEKLTNVGILFPFLPLPGTRFHLYTPYPPRPDFKSVQFSVHTSLDLEGLNPDSLLFIVKNENQFACRMTVLDIQTNTEPRFVGRTSFGVRENWVGVYIPVRTFFSCKTDLLKADAGEFTLSLKNWKDSHRDLTFPEIRYREARQVRTSLGP